MYMRIQIALIMIAAGFFTCARAQEQQFTFKDRAPKPEIITAKEDYFPGEEIKFTIRGRIMYSKDSGGKIVSPPYAIWDGANKKVPLRHSCESGLTRAYDQQCVDGKIRELEVGRCPEAFFHDYGVINQQFSWDQKIFRKVRGECGGAEIFKEEKVQAPPGEYRIVVCSSVQECVDKPVYIRSEPEVSITTDKKEYASGETVKITITNNCAFPVFNVDRNKTISDSDSDGTRRMGWGFIEKFRNGVWLRVEPLWRCAGACFSRCPMGADFFILSPKGMFPGGVMPGDKGPTHGDFIRLEWEQSQVICIPKETKKAVSSGKYRVVSTFLMPGADPEREAKQFYSLEFEIK